MNVPYQTMGSPVVELSSYASSARRVAPPSDTLIPPNGVSRAPDATGTADPYKFEPSVFGAARHHRALVLALAILGMLAAVGYTGLQPTAYKTEAHLTVPLPPSTTATVDPGQYLDSQVLLLQSQGVAQRAASIANSHLGANTLSSSDFTGSSLTVSPPATATPGGYGASIVAVSFQGSSRQIAQVGLDSVLQAFQQASANAIRQQAQATMAGLNTAIQQSTSAAERARLQTQQTQTLANEQTDLAATPTAAYGPVTSTKGHSAVDAVIGLIAGLVVGVGLAYALAVRKRPVLGAQDGLAIYGVPMIAETPAFPVTDGVAPMVSDPGSPLAEAFRFTASSVERTCAAQGMPLTLAFVAPRAGSGKSTMVANLALAMAERGVRLLVVDADAAGGVTTQLLPGITVTEGFEQALRGQRTLADVVQHSPLNDAIAVLGAGSTPRSLAGPARARAARALLAEAKLGFDIVIVDAPALLEIADAAELADTADAAIIVISAGDRTPDHLEMVNWLKSTSTRVVGYLYNQAKARPHGRHVPQDGSTTREPSSASR